MIKYSHNKRKEVNKMFNEIVKLYDWIIKEFGDVVEFSK